MAGISMGVVFEERRLRGFDSWSAIGFALGGTVLWVGAARAFFVGVYARPQGTVVRRSMWTVTVPWARSSRMPGAIGSGAAGLAGATSPADRAIDGLNAHLRRWREQR